MKRPQQSKLSLLLTISLFFGSFALADESEEEKEPDYKYATWNLGLAWSRYQWESTDAGDENEVLGNAGILQFGGSKNVGNWMLGGNINVILGPYTEVRAEQVRTDFLGTGLDMYSGYAFNSGGIRALSGSYGMKLGFNYQDIVGRSIKQTSTTDDNLVIDDYTLRVSSLNASIGLFYAAFKPARLSGNTTELLMTRIEGYSIDLSFLYPVKTTYSARYQVLDRTTNEQSKKKERGEFRGYSSLISLTAYLGV